VTLTDVDTTRRVHAVTRIVPRGRVTRRVVAVVVVVLALGGLSVVVRNENFGWPIVGEFLFSPVIMQGLWNTLWLTVVAVVGGFVIGVLLTAMRNSGTAALAAVSWTYVWFFRSSPLLVQLLFWFNIAALFPVVSFGIPFGAELTTLLGWTGVGEIEHTFFAFDTRNIISGLTAAILGLVLHEGAYAAEIVRGGVAGVDAGQLEAAHSLGLPRTRIFARIVLPQAMRTIVPNLGNMIISVLKATSILSVIAVADLLYSAQIIYNANYRVIPLLIVATIWYLVITSILSIAQYYVERRFARGAQRVLPPTPLQRARIWLQSRLARRTGVPA